MPSCTTPSTGQFKLDQGFLFLCEQDMDMEEVPHEYVANTVKTDMKSLL